MQSARKRRKAPSLPAPIQDRAEQDARDNARVEQLMRRGFAEPREIAPLVDLSPTVVERHMRQVLTRWETIGSGKNVSRYRGEIISRMNTIQQEIWTEFQNSTDGKCRVALLGLAERTVMDMAKVQGLAPKVVEKIMMNATEKGGIADRIQKQDRMMQFLKDLNHEIQERRKARGDLKIIDIPPIDRNADEV